MEARKKRKQISSLRERLKRKWEKKSDDNEKMGKNEYLTERITRKQTSLKMEEIQDTKDNFNIKIMEAKK